MVIHDPHDERYGVREERFESVQWRQEGRKSIDCTFQFGNCVLNIYLEIKGATCLVKTVGFHIA